MNFNNNTNKKKKKKEEEEDDDDNFLVQWEAKIPNGYKPSKSYYHARNKKQKQRYKIVVFLIFQAALSTTSDSSLGLRAAPSGCRFLCFLLFAFLAFNRRFFSLASTHA